MTKPKYIQLIDESVKASKDYLARHELLHYMIDPDKSEIDGTRAEKDNMPAHDVYKLSSYSTLIEVKEMLHKEWKTKDALPLKLGIEEPEDDEVTETLKELLAGVKGTKKSNIKIVTNIDDIPEKDREAAMEALAEVLAKLTKKNKKDKEK